MIQAKPELEARIDTNEMKVGLKWVEEPSRGLESSDGGRERR